jgi:hypothetical protein
MSRVLPNREGSPKPRGSAWASANAVPIRKMMSAQGFKRFAAGERGGNKLLLTMFARQVFPTATVKERVH